MKVKNPHILDFEKRRAIVNMIVPFVQGYGAASAPVDQAVLLSLEAPLFAPTVALESPEFASIDQIVPKDTDFIYPIFRALSASLIPGYWVDFSKEGVLKKSVAMLYGQTVYKNHGEGVFWKQFDVEKWLGAVSQSVWDAKGDKVGGVPGINVELKIDALLNPRIARGLLMKPPAIHSVSVSVEFEFDYSHEDLLEQDNFHRMLGQEVDGEIVRFIVTEIYRYIEISLVYQGADGDAKQVETDEEEFNAPGQAAGGRRLEAVRTGSSNDRVKPKETNTVKLNAEQQKKLGLVVREGEDVVDVPDAVVISAVELLADRAAAADVLVASARAECLRQATLAEVGAAEGDDAKLPPVIADVIKAAGPAQLESLTKLYKERAEAKFKPTCQACGSQNVATRSSVEDASALPDGSTKPAPAYTGANRLH